MSENKGNIIQFPDYNGQPIVDNSALLGSIYNHPSNHLRRIEEYLDPDALLNSLSGEGAGQIDWRSRYQGQGPIDIIITEEEHTAFLNRLQNPDRMRIFVDSTNKSLKILDQIETELQSKVFGSVSRALLYEGTSIFKDLISLHFKAYGKKQESEDLNFETLKELLFDHKDRKQVWEKYLEVSKKYFVQKKEVYKSSGIDTE